MGTRWIEIGDRVYVRRYAFYDQNIVVVRGGDQALVVDTRSTPDQARELIADIRALGIGRVDVVVNTHGHHDHAFGNHDFRPTVIWGHDRCVTMIERTGDAQRRTVAAELPELADELAAVILDPPDRTFAESAVIDLEGRPVELRYLGRGHTDNDIIVRVTDADVLCAGDLLENGAVPYFGDAYPMDWPATVLAMLHLTGPSTVVVPGHGDHAGLAFVERALEELRAVAERASRVERGLLALDDALADGPWPAAQLREPLARALMQVRGELGT